MLRLRGMPFIFTRLAECYWQRVFSHTLAYIKNPKLIEETTQGIFAKIRRKRNKLVQVESFKGYLSIIL